MSHFAIASSLPPFNDHLSSTINRSASQ